MPDVTIVHATIDPATGFIYQDQLGNNTSASGAKYLSDGFEWKVPEFTDLNGEVTNAMLRDGAACSVIGRAANSSGEVADIAAASNGKYLTRQGDALSFAAPLAADLSGAVAIANGGTGQTSQTAAFDALAPTTTQGDAIYHDGTDNVRVAVGTNGQILVANSSATPGVAYTWRPMVITFQAASGTDLTWTNQPAAVSLLLSNARHVQKHDLAGFRQARLCCWKAGAAAATGAKLYLRYSTSHSTTATDYSAIGASDATVSIDTTNAFLDSGWVDLVAGAMADGVFLAVIGEGGDGSADPTFGTIYAMFR